MNVIWATQVRPVTIVLPATALPMNRTMGQTAASATLRKVGRNRLSHGLPTCRLSHTVWKVRRIACFAMAKARRWRSLRHIRESPASLAYCAIRQRLLQECPPFLILWRGEMIAWPVTARAGWSHRLSITRNGPTNHACYATRRSRCEQDARSALVRARFEAFQESC